VPLRICVQFCPPSVDWKAPRPERPVYKIRDHTGEEVSSTSERASTPAPVPDVQF
jgi:hypothetical protein